MRTTITILAAALIGSVAFAQQPDPGAVITFASSADVAALAAKAKSQRKGDQPALPSGSFSSRLTMSILNIAPPSAPPPCMRPKLKCFTSSMAAPL